MKGDIARAYFYMTVAYSGIWAFDISYPVSKNRMNAWMETEMYVWHLEDPVD